MTAQIHPNHDPRPLEEELVAYLDEELPGERRLALEQRLADEPTVREQLRRLSRVWDALDTLPRSELRDNFATTTVEAIVSHEQVGSASHALQSVMRQRGAWWLKRGAAVLACAMLGFLLISSLWPDPNRALARDLRIIERLNEYRQAGNIEFLRLLDEKGLFSASLETPPTPDSVPDAPDTIETRLTHIQALPPQAKAVLYRNREMFTSSSISPPERESLRELDRQLASDPHEDELRRVMAAYASWVAVQSPGERAKLQSVPVQERVQFVQDLHNRTLSPRDQRALNSWLREFVQNPDNDHKFREMDFFKRRENGDERKLYDAGEIKGDGQRLIAIRAVSQSVSEGALLSQLPFDDVDFVELAKRLSVTAAKVLNGKTDLMDKKRQFAEWRNWIEQEAIRDRRPREQGWEPSQDDMLAMLAEMPLDRKYELFMLPPDQVRAQLHEQYLFQPFDRAGFFGGPGFGPAPPSQERPDRERRRDGDRDNGNDQRRGNGDARSRDRRD